MTETDAMKFSKLIGKSDYHTWVVAMRASLRLADLWKYVVGVADENKDARRDELAKSRIELSIDKDLYAHIDGLTTAKEVWDKLAKVCGGDGLLRRVQLMTKLVNTKLDSCKGMDDYVSTIITTVHQLRQIKFAVTDDWACTFLLAGLPESFEPMVMALQNSGKELLLEDLQVSLIQRGPGSTTTVNDALLTSGTGRHKKAAVKCFSCGGVGHYSRDCRAKKTSGQSDGACFKCGRQGHRAAQCHGGPKGNRDQGQGKTMFVSALVTNGQACADWIVDSGASTHMTYNKVKGMKPVSTKIVVTADGQSLEVLGEGSIDVILRTDSGTNACEVQRVLHVPKLSVNLLSVSQMCKNGKEVRFRGNKCTILDGDEVMGEAVAIGGLYRLRTVDSARAAVTKVDGDIWHRRLGHLNGQYLLKMKEKIGPCSGSSECDTCVVCKITRGPFKTSDSRAAKKLELVHSDVVQMDVLSNGGNRYFVTFLDDYSRKLWFYPMKNKTETLDKFKLFKTTAEGESNQKVLSLRTDNGGEYIGKLFQEYLRQENVRHQLTVPYNPEQNGAAERPNRTILNRVRCMLTESNLPKSLWAEAANTAVYLINRSPAKAIQFRFPEEMWTGGKLSLGYLRVFGSKVVAHVPKEKRRKLDNPGREGVLVGYGENQKGYRVFYGNETRVECNVHVFEGTFSTAQKRDTILEGVNFDVMVGNERYIEEDRENVEDLDQYEMAQEGEELVVRVPMEPVELLVEDPVEPVTVRRSSRIAQQREQSNFLIGPEQDEAVGEEAVSKAACSDQHVDVSYLTKSLPSTVAEARECEESEKWCSAMAEELKSLREHGTWDLVERPANIRVLKNRWVFTRKESTDKAPFKARLVVKGYMQNDKGLDTFSPVVRYDTIRTVLSVASAKGMKMAKFDVKTAFLNGRLKEAEYMEQPEGFKDETGRVCKLLKSLYGLKQAPRCWGEEIERVMISLGFKSGESDRCLFTKTVGQDVVYVLLYVDDGLVISTDICLAKELLDQLEKHFRLTKSFQVTSFLGMEVAETMEGIQISQGGYIGELVKRFRLVDATVVPNPIPEGWTAGDSRPFSQKRLYQELIGSLRYLNCVTRPDISFALTRLSSALENPTEAHWTLAKRVVRYIKGTASWGLEYSRGVIGKIGMYTDADYAGEMNSRRSTSGVLGFVGESVVVWGSRLQSIVALSTTEAELIAAVEGVKEGLWLTKVMTDLGIRSELQLYSDNQSALSLLKDPTVHRRTKHIEVRMSFLRDAVDRKRVVYKFVTSKEQLADPLTKPLSGQRMVEWMSGIGPKKQ